MASCSIEKMNYDYQERFKSKDMEDIRFFSNIESHPRMLFGGYPTRDGMVQLQNMNVKYIVDLTTPIEKNKLGYYYAKDYGMTYISFPIRDNFVPYDMDSFNEFIVSLMFIVNNMKDNEYIYIHCKGGHGRSGMIVCCLLCLMYGKTPSQSIHEVTHGHRQRPLLSSKWKMRLCPSNEIQRVFVDRIFRSHNMMNNAPLTRELENVFNNVRKRILLYKPT